MSQIFRLLGAFIVSSSLMCAQSTSATLNGEIVDPGGAIVSAARITLKQPAVGFERSTTTDGDGSFTFPGLAPGVYRIEASAMGFATFLLEAITLNVSDTRRVRIQLELARTADQVTVVAKAASVSDVPWVSTVIDREFVEKIPLNGRSLQTLIGLTPGVAYASTAVLEQGQFSINGQRANANYFTVDGVSANFGISPTTELGQTGSGALPAFGTSGGTNTLVSADAAEEFKVLTSPFAPEFGRQPGGQISVATRSGSNDWHGSLFWYFRNDKLDANDWFANRDGLEKPKLRQNNFGGTFGGPVIRNRTFFFLSHETLRLRFPLVLNLPVPSAATRAAAPSALQPYLNAYPVATGPNLNGGYATFSAGYSEVSDLDATSVRVDHRWSDRWTMFGRYNHAPSDALQRAANLNTASVLSSTGMKTDTLTLGSTGILSPTIVNDLRGNYSRATAQTASEMDSFGGATPLSNAAMFPSFTNRENALFQFIVTGGGNLFSGRETLNTQNQFNITDNLSVAAGGHQLKFGIDYRTLLPDADVRGYQQTVQFSNLGSAAGGVLSGRPLAVQVLAAQPSSLRYSNFSAYAQDSWRPIARLTLTYGLRWEYNPPPAGRDGTKLATFRDSTGGYGDVTSLAIATDQALFETTKSNFAPRVGAAFQLSRKTGWETVLRGGYGLFYDLGTGSYNPTLNPPLAVATLRPAQYPVEESQLAPPAAALNPPYGNITAADPNLKLPRVHQYNAAIEQSFGAGQVFSVTYAGAIGRKLLRTERLRNPRPDITNLRITTNSSTSDYHALQLQFSRRLAQGLQLLTSYNWAHSIDTLSSDFFSSPATTVLELDPDLDRGSSDFDIRHAFTGAVTYTPPKVKWSAPVLVAILDGWSADSIFRVQSAVPVTVFSARNIGFGAFAFRPNLVAGQPLYLEGPQYPGGKTINRAAFSVPSESRQGDLGRNTLRGFSLGQVDFAVRRTFRLTERVNLNFGAEMFNIFNHPSFAPPVADLSSPQFGQSTQMLGRSLGSGGPGGGLSPLYQVGGPRSIQFSLRLQL